jgi:hypothetical protein
MKEKIKLFCVRYADAFLAASLASFLIFLFTRHSGIGLSPDSIAYLSTSEHIAQSFSFTDFSGAAFVNFPLGYPVFLTLTHGLFSFPILNAILFSSVLFITAAIMRQMTNTNKIIRCCFLLFFACCSPLLEVYGMLWSETVFVPLCLFLINYLYKYSEVNTYKNLIKAAIICGLLFFVRYAGIAGLLAGSLIILIQYRVAIQKRIVHVFIFGSISIILPLINLIRNLLITGTYTGVRQQAQRSLWDNLLDTASVITNWLPSSTTFAISMLLAIMLLGASMILYAVLKHASLQKIELPIAVFFLSYISFILTIASISRFETLSNRLLIPLFIPFFLLLYYLICKSVAAEKKTIRIISICFFIISYSALQYHHYQQNKASWEGIASAGIPGYAEDMWANSALLAHIKKQPIGKDQIVYANANDALYYGTKHNALSLPHKDIPAEIKVYEESSPIILVWFFYGENEDLISLEKALEKRTILHSYQFNDGLLIYCK